TWSTTWCRPRARPRACSSTCCAARCATGCASKDGRPMHLLSPLFAVFALLAGLPVLIHLIGRSRAKVRPLPTLLLLIASHRRVARRTKLRHVLLLLLRVAVMALVPLLLARPYFETTSDLPAQVGATQRAVLIIDDSMSMNYQPTGGSSVLVGR